MAFAWADTFVPPTASDGLSNGDHTDIDEWPWTSSECYLQTASGGSGTVSFTFNMSNGPGDKKGFRVWFRAHCHSNQSVGWNITEVRLTDGTSTLWTSSGLTINIDEPEDTFADSFINVIDIPDSAFSGDPDISGLVLELDCDNLDSGNGRLSFTGMRMSKSPFTAAQEASLPADLAGANFSCYRAEDRSVLGAVDGETWVVWPDASGKGRHLIQLAGSTATIEDDTIEYVDFPSTANRFASHFGTRVTGNHIWHKRWYMVDTGAAQVITSFANEFKGVVEPATDPNDKNLVGVDDNGSAGNDRIVIMSGDGTGPTHEYGSLVSFDTWYRTTLWVQDSGNEHLWFNDDASPDIDFASGSNNMFTISVGDRESDDRRFQGRVAEVWWIDGAGITEADIDGARDEWVNGPSSGQDIAVGTIAETDVLVASSAEKPLVASVGLVAETETLIAATPVKAIIGPVGAIEETTNLMSIGGAKTAGIGLVTENESLNPVVGVKPILQAVGVLANVDTLNEVSTVKVTDVGAIDEIEALLQIGAVKPVFQSVGLVATSESLIGVSAVKPIVVPVDLLAQSDELNAIQGVKPVVRDVGALVTAETLNPIQTVKDIIESVGSISELENLLSVAAVKPIVEPVGVLSSSDSLIAVQAVKDILTDVGVIPESNTPISIQALKVAGVGTLTEVETLINTPPVGQQIINIGIISSTNALLSIPAVKPILETVGILTEVDSLVAIEALKPLVTNVTPLTESDALIALAGRKTAFVSPLIETESLVAIAVQIGGDQDIAVGLITEIDALVAIQGLKPIVESVGTLGELDSPIAISDRKTIDLGTISEINALIQTGALKPIIRAIGGDFRNR